MNQYVFITILLVCIVNQAISRRFYEESAEEDAILNQFARRRMNARELLDGLLRRYLEERDEFSSGSFMPSGSFSGGSFMPSGSFDSGSFMPSGSFDSGSFMPSGSFDSGSFMPSGSFDGGSFMPSGSFGGGSFMPSGSFGGFSSRREFFDDEDLDDLYLRSSYFDSYDSGYSNNPTYGSSFGGYSSRRRFFDAKDLRDLYLRSTYFDSFGSGFSNLPSYEQSFSSWIPNNFNSASLVSYEQSFNSWIPSNFASSSWPFRRRFQEPKSRAYRVRSKLNDNHRRFYR